MLSTLKDIRIYYFTLHIMANRKLFYVGLGIFLLPLVLAIVSGHGEYTYFGFLTTPVGIGIMIFSAAKEMSEKLKKKEEVFAGQDKDLKLKHSKRLILVGLVLGFGVPFLAGMILGITQTILNRPIIQFFYLDFIMPIFTLSGITLIIFGTYRLFSIKAKKVI